MTNAELRRGARERRRKRKDLVHAAGCVYDNCCVREAVFNDFSIVTEAIVLGTRIPRSVRRAWAWRIA